MTRGQRVARDHELMVAQRRIRRETGRPLKDGDLVQIDIGGEIREVTSAYSAGECFEAKAELRALAARTERTGNN
jgi:hypothetical protein